MTCPAVKEAIAAGKHVVCSLAPSFIADFRIRSLDVMTDALKRLGFAEVQETAVGAQLVSDEYARIMREGKQRVLISSCCPSINMLIQKYYPTMLPHLAKVLTPMQAHCKAIKEQNPEAFTVFIGPCIAKKAEADDSPYTDVALTYDELRDWLAAEHIELPTDHVEPGDGKRARFYPATGGVLKATDKVEGYRRIAIDGVDNCRAVFDELENSQFGNVFIEMSAARAAASTAPASASTPSAASRARCAWTPLPATSALTWPPPIPSATTIPSWAARRSSSGPRPSTTCSTRWARPAPKGAQLRQLRLPHLPRQGHRHPGRQAKIEMCLPFLKEKAESFSDSIINNTPTPSSSWTRTWWCSRSTARRCACSSSRTQTTSCMSTIVRILNPGDYQNIITSALHTTTRMHYLADYQLYVDETILYDRQYHIVISLMRDVTEQETLRGQDAELRRQTVEITDKVIEKQMRVVQEIASLLGETTAETKIALTKLKDAMAHE